MMWPASSLKKPANKSSAGVKLGESLVDKGGMMVEKYIETLPFTASVFIVALTIVAVLIAVFLLLTRLVDDHPVVFVIVMVVVTFLIFNFLLSLGGVA